MDEIFRQVYNDVNTKVSPEDIDSWLSNIDDSQYNYLEHKTTSILCEEIDDLLSAYPLYREKWVDSLKMYRAINDLRELRLGNHTRWVVPDQDKLHSGGYLTKVDFREKGVYLLCEINKRVKMQVKMENTFIFQKLTPEEWVIIMANEFNTSS